MPDKWDKFAGPSGEQCRRCYYFIEWAGEDAGNCRRFPPNLKDSDDEISFFETTTATSWCGEFRQHPNRQPGAEAGANT